MSSMIVGIRYVIIGISNSSFKSDVSLQASEGVFYKVLYGEAPGPLQGPILLYTILTKKVPFSYILTVSYVSTCEIPSLL